MNREDIIRMAEEAGARQQVSCFTHPDGPITAYQFKVDEGSLEKFAQLVAEHEREQIAKMIESQKVMTLEPCNPFADERVRAIKESQQHLVKMIRARTQF